MSTAAASSHMTYHGAEAQAHKAPGFAVSNAGDTNCTRVKRTRPQYVDNLPPWLLLLTDIMVGLVLGGVLVLVGLAKLTHSQYTQALKGVSLHSSSVPIAQGALALAVLLRGLTFHLRAPAFGGFEKSDEASRFSMCAILYMACACLAFGLVGARLMSLSHRLTAVKLVDHDVLQQLISQLLVALASEHLADTHLADKNRGTPRLAPGASPAWSPCLDAVPPSPPSSPPGDPIESLHQVVRIRRLAHIIA